MAYDLILAGRLRTLLAGRRDVTEKVMFGGLAFLLDGKMFCGVLGNELLARVGPDAHDAAMARPNVRIMDFTGRPMRGYVFVGPAALGSDVAIAYWADACARHAETLPEKRKKAAKPAARPAAPSPARAAAGGSRRAPRRRARGASGGSAHRAR